ncbi:unnamed protein product, partial [Cylindrotheca closterium]
MAKPAILRQLFVRIGLTQAVADTIVDDHNINSTATLTKIKPDTVSKLVKTLPHPGGGGNGHAIPFQVQQDITDVAWLIKHRVRTSRDPAILTIVLTPAQQRRARESERKQKMDLENNVPSPLFIMVLPGEMEGTYLFISRLKYAALATNVLKGLVPFFTHHLGASTTTRSNRVLGKWFPKSLIHTTRRKELVWCLETLRARPADQTQQGVDKAIDFLDGFGSDPLDVGEAKLEFDMDMADAKDIDDGATVAGA